MDLDSAMATLYAQSSTLETCKTYEEFLMKMKLDPEFSVEDQIRRWVPV